MRRGEFYSLLGPSGCGKTTTLRCVAGFEHPDAGSIRIRAEDVTGVPPHRRNVNTVFQHYALFPHLTVSDNVAYGLKRRDLSKEELARRLQRALATVRLTELAERRPRELSGGQPWAFFVQVEAVGTRDGRRVVLRQQATHPEGWGQAATGRMTSVPAVVGATMLARGRVEGVGVLPPERAFDPERFLRGVRGLDVRVRSSLREPD